MPESILFPVVALTIKAEYPFAFQLIYIYNTLKMPVGGFSTRCFFLPLQPTGMEGFFSQEDSMSHTLFHERINQCALHMEEEGLDVLLLTKPSNMFYLTGDGRLCAYSMITQKGEVALGVPMTDVEELAGWPIMIISPVSTMKSV
jgi:hypothetical protein